MNEPRRGVRTIFTPLRGFLLRHVLPTAYAVGYYLSPRPGLWREESELLVQCFYGKEALLSSRFYDYRTSRRHRHHCSAPRVASAGPQQSPADGAEDGLSFESSAHRQRALSLCQ